MWSPWTSVGSASTRLVPSAGLAHALVLCTWRAWHGERCSKQAENVVAALCRPSCLDCNRHVQGMSCLVAAHHLYRLYLCAPQVADPEHWQRRGAYLPFLQAELARCVGNGSVAACCQWVMSTGAGQRCLQCMMVKQGPYQSPMQTLPRLYVLSLPPPQCQEQHCNSLAIPAACMCCGHARLCSAPCDAAFMHGLQQPSFGGCIWTFTATSDAIDCALNHG